MPGKANPACRKQRKTSEADLTAPIDISHSTLQLIGTGISEVEVGLVFEAAVLVDVPLFSPDPLRTTSEIARVEDKLALLPQSAHRPRKESSASLFVESQSGTRVVSERSPNST